MLLYLGLDWDQKQIKAQASTLIGNTERIIFQKPNITSVSETIEELRTRFPGTTKIIAVLEAGAKQWNYLLDSSDVELYVTNPKQAKRFKESLQSSFAKDDFRDAKALLAMAKSPDHLKQIKQWKIPSEQEQQIELLTKMHEELTTERTKLKQQFRAHLQKRIPMIEKVIGDVESYWVSTFFSKIPSLWKLKKLSKERFDTILTGSSIRTTTQENLWKAILDSRQPWASKEMHEVEEMRMNGFIARLKELSKQQKLVNAKIEEVLEMIPVARSICKIKGLGSICTLGMFQYGKLSSLKGRDDLSAILGASPVFIGSGSQKDGSPKGYATMRRAVPNQAKNLTYTIGLLLTRHSKWAKAMFQYNKQKQKSAGTIFRQIARSFFRILSSMIKNGTEYDEDLYIRSLKKNGVVWAQNL